MIWFILYICRAYKVSYTPSGEGEFIKCVGEEYQVVKRGRNINALRKNITWEKGKDINWGRGRKFCGRK